MARKHLRLPCNLLGFFGHERTEDMKIKPLFWEICLKCMAVPSFVSQQVALNKIYIFKGRELLFFNL